jgi:hypothetical protein
MKTCSDCKQEKQLNDYTFDKSRNRHLSICKKCTAIRTEAYRQTHKDKWRIDNKKHSEKRSKVINEWKSKGCVKCGDTRSYVIDAHHIDPTQKQFSVGTTVRGIKPTQQELDKCIPLCSNCHREFHHMEHQQNITLEEYLK